MNQKHYNELMKIAADLETEGDGAIAKSLRDALAAPSAPAVDAGARDEREIWEYSYIHSSALGRPDEKVTLLTYDKKSAFGHACFDQKLVHAAGVAIAEVCEDADGFKHIAEIVEELDDIPAGTKLYARAALSASTEAAAGEFIPNTCAGFRGGFIALNKRAPTDQEVWNAGVKSAIKRYAPPAASGQKLTDEQISAIAEPYWNFEDSAAGYRTFNPVGFARAVLRAIVRNETGSSL
ncbi:hypothetical protein [Paraburkholderia caribensis]|uniref:hypothetical protein n=1 Tax=Paraburkholderia caribensis TaxID=75105 RepID=UPI0034D36D84